MRCPTCHRTYGSRIGLKTLSLREKLVAKMSTAHAFCVCGFPAAKSMLAHNGKCEDCRKSDLTAKRTIPMKLEACR